MIIYLAELSHFNKYRSPNVVPLAAGYLAATIRKYFPESKIKIFRDPNKLLESVRSEMPDFVGFSVYLWSEKISSFCAEKIKKINNNIVIAAGGASIDDLDDEMHKYLKSHIYYDVCVSNEGEIPLKNLIGNLSEFGKFERDKIIEGCATLSSDGSLNRAISKDLIPNLSEIPSPYLGGFLDQFLEDGYIPILQSMRGCPYSCSFCVSGSPFWKKIRSFDLNRVLSEFDYIKKKTKNDFLILTDENFGILKERDIKIAEHMLNSYRDCGFPSRLYFYPAKIINDFVLMIMEILSPLGELSISFQSLDDSVKKNIKRTNINYDEFINYINWAKKRNIITSTEMIFGLPGETVSGYLDSLEKLLKSGVDRIYSYNLRLLAGTDLATSKSIEENKFKLRYRLPERTYGIYNGNIITETENVVVGSAGFNFEDYLKIRKYGLFLELSSGRGYFSKLIEIMIKMGLPGEKLVKYLSEEGQERNKKLNNIVGQFIKAAKDELFDNPDECMEFVKKCILRNDPVPEVKLNLIYTGKIIINNDVAKEVFSAVKNFIDEVTDDVNIIDLLNDYINNILSKQIVRFNVDEPDVIESETRIVWDKIMAGNFTSINELIDGKIRKIKLVLSNDANNYLKNKMLFAVPEETKYQDLYMSVSRFGLLRHAKEIC